MTEKTQYPQPAMPSNALAAAVCTVAEARGFVAFGAGVYKVTQTAEPGLVVTFRRQGEEGRAVSERAEAPDLTPIQPEDMIVRLQFTSAAGLDSLEDHLREIRAEHWPETVGGQSAKQWLDQRKGAASKEWMAGWDACRAAGQAFQAPEGAQALTATALSEMWRLACADWNAQIGAQPDPWEHFAARVAVALAAQPQAPAWQPTETAPKDGRDLLLWESGSYVPFVGAWRDGRRPGWHCDTEHYNTDGDSCVISNLWQEGVTHWMPLPAAPQTKEPKA